MKTIGLLGGMSWESTTEYYKIINEHVAGQLGGFHSAKIIMYSYDFHELEKNMKEEAWENCTSLLIDGARLVEKAGADMLLICTNTMHLMAHEVQQSVEIPLIHIVDAVADEIKEAKLEKVGLLGTSFTMEKDFYKGRLASKHKMEVIIPEESDRRVVHDIIFNELCTGKIFEESREKFKKIISNMVEDGARGVILGCTEIPLLIKAADVNVPLFDTTRIHAVAAADLALKE
jgi:aspartate racemase